MRSLLLAAALPAVALAYGAQDQAQHKHVVARQASSASASAAPSTSAASTSAVSTSGASVTSATGTASGAPTSAPATQATSYSVSLASTNPTALPLDSIVALGTTVPRPTVTTPAAGSTPTYMKAPALPDLSKFKLSDYPTPDVIPPTDSPEVKQWIKEVNDSGVKIPDFKPTVTGGCAANPEAAADKSRCWWTCGGCTGPEDISDCPEPRSWGLTYDDGPAFYTPNLLDYLDEQKLKATFFIIGSRAVYLPAVLQREYLSGHQISVHTYSHHLLTEMTNDQIIAELGWSKKVIKDIIGVTPNTFRPPQGDMDDRVRAIAKAMGLTPIMWTRVSPTVTFNTQDFEVNAGTVTPNQVLYNWKNILNNATQLDHGFIVLEHDLWPQCVEIATGYILPDALAHEPKFKIEPVNTCLSKDMKEAYIELASATAGNSSTSGTKSGSSSGANATDGSNAALHVVPGALALAATLLAMLAL